VSRLRMNRVPASQTRVKSQAVSVMMNRLGQPFDIVCSMEVWVMALFVSSENILKISTE
jgi:hypothetical protein